MLLLIWANIVNFKPNLTKPKNALILPKTHCQNFVPKIALQHQLLQLDFLLPPLLQLYCVRVRLLVVVMIFKFMLIFINHLWLNKNFVFLLNNFFFCAVFDINLFLLNVIKNIKPNLYQYFLFCF